ncbi:hypothetical protein ACFY2R_02865 [Micromonospora olivasterospora]
MDLLSMWACVQDHDTTGHWKQVAGWRKVCDLAQAHLGRLQEYRRGLAEAWPPATNAAARTYLAELDDLIEKVQHTHDAAAANYDALAAATRAISGARVELKPLYEEYVDKLQQKRTYEATLADPKAVMGSRVPDKPVTDADLERLNVQARSLMYGLSGELQQAQVMLQRPPPSKPGPRVDDAAPEGPSGANVPVIPPIVPVPMAAAGSTTPSVNRPASAVRPALTRTSLGVGPVLGGAPGLVPTPVKPGPPAVTPPGPPTPAPEIGLPTPSHPVSGSSDRSAAPGSRGGQTEPVGRAMSGGANGAAQVAPPSRPMPPGGLIGGAPGMGMGHPGGANPARRVNPVGGIIGSGAGTAPTGGAGTRPGVGRGNLLGGMHGMPPINGAPSTGSTSRTVGTPGRPGRKQDESELRQWDPDNPWETQQGVSPVVRPPNEEGPIDPGPAIGFGR